MKEFKMYSAMWREAYPELYKGMLDFILYPENYPKLFGLGKNFIKNLFAGFVFEDKKEKNIFGGAILVLDIKNRSGQGLIMAVMPEYRKKITTGKFLYKFIEKYDKFLKNSGIEYAWVGAVANHITTQKLLKHVGYKVRGVIPGMSLAAVNKFYYHRDNYVYMDKFYNDGERRISSKMKLIPEARQIWDILNVRE